ncbi:MAG: ABC transporter substrate-binding protein [Trueperaceae bacterium]|nr:ABC transporter substrate-binding protein [Trueperaceae bacterium]
MRRLTYPLFVISLLALVSFAAAQQYGGVLRVGMQTDPVGLDPHTTNATATRNMLENVYDTLVMFDSSGQIVPALAESWSASEDGLTWTFVLREGVTFHNGEPLTASDVVFSIERIRDPAVASPRSNDFAVLESIIAPTDDTVVMTLSRPFSPLLSKLAFSLNVIVSEDVVAEAGDLQEVVIGTGPFVFDEYIPQTRMVLSRNDAFWGTNDAGEPLPYLDGITFTFYPDPTARSTAVQTGNVDWIEYVPAPDIALLQADPDVAVVGGLSANFRSLYLNVTEPPLDNRLVRQAIAFAIDEQAIVDLALFGTGGVPATGTTIPVGNYYAYPDSPYIGRDVEQAEALLAEAGFADGFDLDIYVTSTYDFLRAPAEVIQANLADVGIRVNIIAEDWSIYLPTVQEGRFVATILGESGQADPDDYLYSPFYTGAGGNFSQYSNPELDTLLEAGRQTSEQQARRDIYLDAQEVLLADVPHVFLFHSAQYEALQTDVSGFEHFPNTSYLGLRETWLER